MDRQIPVKILPPPKLRLRAVNIGAKAQKERIAQGLGRDACRMVRDKYMTGMLHHPKTPFSELFENPCEGSAD